MKPERVTDSRAQLLARKQDLFEALRVLDDDRVEGTVDPAAYQEARQRYELEAASILERLDKLQGMELPAQSPGSGRQSRWPAASWTSGDSRRTSTIAIGALLLTLAALALFLVAATHGRLSGQSITGFQPQAGGRLPAGVTATPGPPSQLVAAQQSVRRHPGNVDALLTLGQAELNAGEITAADKTYRQAMRLAPSRPEAPTLDALILASWKRYDAGLALLHRVELTHPDYARAWLTDGLIASRRRPGYPRAIAAWKHFLALSPSGAPAQDVRASLAALERVVRSGR